MFGTHNLTLYVWCGFGANYDRSLRDPRDIEIHNYPVFWRVVLEKDGLKREIMNASGESGSINLLDFEQRQGVEPPYNLTCYGTFRYTIITPLSLVQNQYPYSTLFQVSVEDEYTLTITYNATRPIEKVLVGNRILTALQRPSIPPRHHPNRRRSVNPRNMYSFLLSTKRFKDRTPHARARSKR